ncbi:MAG: ankyrin repeat domain-containing protein, partial [Dehalococcoidia bacterium]
YVHGKHIEMVKFLLENGARPDNCMFAAAWNDDVESAELFRTHGADVDAVAHDTTPFASAFLWKKFVAAEWFLANGANVDFTDKDGRTALYHAIRKRFTPAQIEMLLKAGADPQHADNQGVTPRQVAERNRDHAIVKLFESAAPAKS